MAKQGGRVGTGKRVVFYSQESDGDDPVRSDTYFHLLPKLFSVGHLRVLATRRNVEAGF